MLIRHIALMLVALTADVFAQSSSQPPKELDRTFGQQGIVLTDFGAASQQARALVVLPDGGLVVGGSAISTTGDDFVVARYDKNGNLDSSFGDGGKTLTDFFGFNEQVAALAVQPDGRLIAAGYVTDSTGRMPDFGVARYNVDGSLDLTFGVMGRVTTNFFVNDEATAILIQGDGKIVACGWTDLGGVNRNFAVARYNTDGTLDQIFGVGGKVHTDFNSNDDQAWAAALQADGKIVLGGFTFDPTTLSDFALVRYNAEGTLDTSFGVGGRVRTDFSGSNDQIFALAIDGAGRILAGGLASNDSGSDFALARYNTDGNLDDAFGVDGKVTTDFLRNDHLSALIIQRDGSILASGAVADPGTGFDAALVMYREDGTADDHFGQGGKITTDFAQSDDVMYAAAQQQNGRIVVAGLVQASNNIPLIGLARYKRNPK